MLALIDMLYELVGTKGETFEEVQEWIQEELTAIDCRFKYEDDEEIVEHLMETYDDLIVMGELLDNIQMILYPIERGSLPRAFRGYDWNEE